MNITEITTLAASALLDKEDLKSAIVNVINQIPDGDNYLQRDLAVIWRAFNKKDRLPKVIKNHPIKSLAAWVAKKDIREYLEYVYVNGENKRVASNAHVLITDKYPVDLPQGYYNVKSGLLDESIISRYPDFQRILNSDFNKEVDLTKPLSVDADNRVKFLEGDMGYAGKYIKLALTINDTGKISENGILRVDNDKFIAIVVPLKL